MCTSGRSWPSHVLGESLPGDDDAASPPLDVTLSFGTDGLVKIHVFLAKPGGSEKLADTQLQLDRYDSLEELAEKAESLSANQFVRILKQAGYSGKANPDAVQAAVAPVIDVALAKFDPLVQFDALRSLHKEIKQSGESPERLGALVRGYAQMGSLSESWWSSAHKVYKARALLYAERLKRKAGNGPVELCHRAFARALVGLHQSALQDLEAARTAGDLSSVEWADAIAAYCRFDLRKLQSLAEESSLGQLPSYLKLLAVAFSDQQTPRLETATHMLQLEPGCTRALEALLFGHAPLELHRRASDEAVALFSHSLRENLPSISDLPQQIRDMAAKRRGGLAAEMQGRAELIDALRKAGQSRYDAGEPSWGALAQLIQEISFLNGWRLLQFQVSMLGVDGSATLSAVRPAVKGHPFEAFIESHERDQIAAGKAWRSLLDSMERTQLQLAHAHLLTILKHYLDQRTAATKVGEMADQAVRQSDPVFMDLALVLPSLASGESKERAAITLHKVSPHSSQGIAAAIKYNWDDAKTFADEWEKRYADDSAVLRALSHTYTELGRLNDAERCLKRQLEIAPEQSTYAELADLYKARGDEKQWLETLYDSLDAPSLGLEHAIVHEKLARHFMRHDEWDQALPHVEATADSYSASGLLCAADYYELRGDLKQSERYYRMTAQRYDGTAIDWYAWCRRTGTGDVKQARSLVEPDQQRLKNWPGADGRYRAGITYLFDDRPAEALEMFKVASQLEQNPYHGLHAALLADELGQTELRDSLLKQSIAYGVKRHHYLVELIHHFQKIIAAGPGADIEPKLLNWIIREAVYEPGMATILQSMTGRFLQLRGRQIEAVALLQLAATSSSRSKYDCALAAILLRKLGVAVGASRKTEFDQPIQKHFDLVQSGRQQVKSGQIDAALTTYAKVIESSPDFVDAYAARAQIYRFQEKFAKAVDDYSLALEKLPESTTLICLRGQTLEFLERYDDALKDYSTALRIDPRCANAHVNLAMLFAACLDEKYRSGRKAVEHALKVQEDGEQMPNQTSAILAAAYAESGDFAQAIQYQTQAFQFARFDRQPWDNERLNLYQRHKPYHRIPAWWRPRETARSDEH